MGPSLLICHAQSLLTNVQSTWSESRWLQELGLVPFFYPSNIPVAENNLSRIRKVSHIRGNSRMVKAGDMMVTNCCMSVWVWVSAAEYYFIDASNGGGGMMRLVSFSPRVELQ